MESSIDRMDAVIEVSGDRLPALGGSYCVELEYTLGHAKNIA